MRTMIFLLLGVAMFIPAIFAGPMDILVRIGCAIGAIFMFCLVTETEMQRD